MDLDVLKHLVSFGFGLTLFFIVFAVGFWSLYKDFARTETLSTQGDFVRQSLRAAFRWITDKPKLRPGYVRLCWRCVSSIPDSRPRRALMN